MAGFRWNRRRDADLCEAIADGFEFWEAANMVGDRCTKDDAEARFEEIRKSYGRQGE